MTQIDEMIAKANVNKSDTNWRTVVPIFHEENCIHCLFCWIYCPHMAVVVHEGKRAEYDYDYCKGCGICALECPGKKGKKAIIMEEEGK